MEIILLQGLQSPKSILYQMGVESVDAISQINPSDQ